VIFLLGANVLSETMKPALSPAVASWLRQQPLRSLFTAAICQAEILGRRPLDRGYRRLDTCQSPKEKTLTIAFDTLKFARALRDKAHIPHEQAEGMAHAFADATSEQIATKGDLKEVETRLEAKISATELRLEAKIAEVKADLAKWTTGQTLVLVGVIVTMLRFAH